MPAAQVCHARLATVLIRIYSIVLGAGMESQKGSGGAAGRRQQEGWEVVGRDVT